MSTYVDPPKKNPRALRTTAKLMTVLCFRPAKRQTTTTTTRSSKMASAARSLRLVSRSCRSQKVLPQLGSKVFVAWKSVGGGAIKDSKVVIDDHRDKPTPFDHWADQDAEIERRFRGLGPQDIARIIMREDADAELGVDQRLESIIDKEKGFQANNPAADAHKEMIDSTRPLRITKVPKKESFWDDEEQDPDLITNDDSDTFDENDMTDIAHAKLEEIREQRAYARTIVWEMPLLSSKCDRGDFDTNVAFDRE